MGAGSTRPNRAEDKMVAALERGTDDDFKDRRPPKLAETKLVQEKAEREQASKDKIAELRALRLAAEKEKKNNK